MLGGCGAPGICGAFGIPGICGAAGWGAGGGVGVTSAVFLTWSSRIVCPAAGFEITDVVPESTRVFPSLARNKR